MAYQHSLQRQDTALAWAAKDGLPLGSGSPRCAAGACFRAVHNVHSTSRKPLQHSERLESSSRSARFHSVGAGHAWWHGRDSASWDTDDQALLNASAWSLQVGDMDSYTLALHSFL